MESFSSLFFGLFYYSTMNVIWQRMPDYSFSIKTARHGAPFSPISRIGSALSS